MNITGKVLGKKNKTVGNDFKICEVYIDITENPDYPNQAMVEFKGKNFEKGDMIKEGKSYAFEFNVRGRKWEKNGKSGFMQSLDAWKFDEVGGESAEDDAGDLPF